MRKKSKVKAKASKNENLSMSNTKLNKFDKLFVISIKESRKTYLSEELKKYENIEVSYD